jgi:hypothetical protein|tara:strand:- start:554 stop:886 length:333 start_codon:yes stop_codon:yes gene_type:complete
MSKVSDNVLQDFPARMSDGRFITDYYPNCEMNAGISNNMSSWQYRLLLSKQSNNVINKMNMFYNTNFGRGSTSGGLDNVFKHRYEQKCNIHGCAIKEVDPTGFGIVQNHE